MTSSPATRATTPNTAVGIRSSYSFKPAINGATLEKNSLKRRDWMALHAKMTMPVMVLFMINHK